MYDSTTPTKCMDSTGSNSAAKCGSEQMAVDAWRSISDLDRNTTRTGRELSGDTMTIPPLYGEGTAGNTSGSGRNGHNQISSNTEDGAGEPGKKPGSRPDIDPDYYPWPPCKPIDKPIDKPCVKPIDKPGDKPGPTDQDRCPPPKPCPPKPTRHPRPDDVKPKPLDSITPEAGEEQSFEPFEGPEPKPGQGKIEALQGGHQPEGDATNSSIKQEILEQLRNAPGGDQLSDQELKQQFSEMLRQMLHENDSQTAR